MTNAAKVPNIQGMSTRTTPQADIPGIWVSTATLTREQVIALHLANVTACQRQISKVDADRARDRSPQYAAACDRAIATLRREITSERELAELARCGEYPYPLLDDDTAPAGR